MKMKIYNLTAENERKKNLVTSENKLYNSYIVTVFDIMKQIHVVCVIITK